MSTADFSQERSVRIAASSIAVATTLSIGALLFRPVALPSTATAMEVVLIDRIVRIDPPPAASSPIALRPGTASPVGNKPDPRRESMRRPENAVPSPQNPSAAEPPPAQPSPAVEAAPPNRWMLPDRFTLRPHNTPDEPAPTSKPHVPGDPSERSQYYAKKLLERRSPLGEQPPPLHDWFGDAAKKAGAREDGQVSVNRVAEAIFGKDIQSAKARPPPATRFRPELHERPSDLGSEATGNAYKAAAVAYEAVPGLEGEASRRIRETIELLLKLPTACERQTVEDWLAPARKHLAELERVEYAYGHGADPIRREHMLPRAADTAYDQARRALSYAEGRLAGCGK